MEFQLGNFLFTPRAIDPAYPKQLIPSHLLRDGRLTYFLPIFDPLNFPSIIRHNNSILRFNLESKLLFDPITKQLPSLSVNTDAT